MTYYLPSLNGIKNYVTSAASYAASWLPYSENSNKATEPTQEIQPLNDKTSAVFKNKVSETVNLIQTEKETIEQFGEISNHLPSLTAIKNYTASWLPQNEHTTKATELTQEIQFLEQSLNDKTGPVFKTKVSETIDLIQTEKEKCIKDLVRMNGDYYQDPKSSLKRTWDTLVDKVGIALGVRTETLEQLGEISDQLNSGSPTEEKEAAKSAIETYLFIEKKRNDRQAQLNLIISTEKTTEPLTDDTLTQQKTSLQQRLRELCGDYYGDPNGKLDQAWKEYQTAVDQGFPTDSTKNFLDAYNGLEKEKRQTEAKLFETEQRLLLPISSERSFEALTTASIQAQIDTLTADQSSESDLSGVDWGRLASSAAKVALISAGYILTT
jgi:hypothetical protein